MIAFSIPVKTTNPNNGRQGFSKGATFTKARSRKRQRHTAGMMTLAAMARADLTLPVVVSVTRVAPSQGLDPHDGLGAALKGIIDGISDGLGLKNDRDTRVQWQLSQRRGRAKEYAVDVAIQCMATHEFQ